MEIAEATELIRVDRISESHPQTWCDLGCGTGTFTLALAALLPSGSVIHAIDKDESSLAQIPDRYSGVTILKQVLDLKETSPSMPALDGVLMANLLHYIEHQGSFVGMLRTLSERLLVVEYEGRSPSKWVPYPLDFSALQGLLLERGFTDVAKIGTRPSRFGGELYSAFAEWQQEQL